MQSKKTIRTIQILILAFAAMLVAPLSKIAQGSQDQLVVIVNRANKIDSLGRSKVRLIFLKEVTRWPWGAEAVPVDLPEKSSPRAEFCQSVLGSPAGEIAVYWIDRRVTRNLHPPVVAANPAAAKEMVASKPGGIAYIPASLVDDTVKVLKLD